MSSYEKERDLALSAFARQVCLLGASQAREQAFKAGAAWHRAKSLVLVKALTRIASRAPDPWAEQLAREALASYEGESR